MLKTSFFLLISIFRTLSSKQFLFFLLSFSVAFLPSFLSSFHSSHPFVLFRSFSVPVNIFLLPSVLFSLCPSFLNPSFPFFTPFLSFVHPFLNYPFLKVNLSVQGHDRDTLRRSKTYLPCFAKSRFICTQRGSRKVVSFRLRGQKSQASHSSGVG